jgi:hypothetical protein
MSETVLGDSGGTDDLSQLLGFIGSSIWLIILKNFNLLWQIAAVIGLYLAYRAAYHPAGKTKTEKKKPEKRRSEPPDDYSSEDEHEERPRSSRGRSPHRK